MIQITVVCPHGQMELSLDDAEQLAADINEKVKKARRTSGPLSDFVERDGYFCRQELFQFFRQYLPEEYISRRIGRLYGAMVRAGSPGWRTGLDVLPLEVVCGKCGSSLDKSCRRPYEESGHRYYRNNWEYYINIAALEKHATHFMPGGSRELSGNLLKSFRILMDHLE